MSESFVYQGFAFQSAEDMHRAIAASWVTLFGRKSRDDTVKFLMIMDPEEAAQDVVDLWAERKEQPPPGFLFKALVWAFIDLREELPRWLILTGRNAKRFAEILTAEDEAVAQAEAEEELAQAPAASSRVH